MGLYGREMIYPIYENLLRDLSKTAFEITGDDENTRPFSVEHFQQKELFYATFSDMINHLNVNEELEKRFKKNHAGRNDAQRHGRRIDESHGTRRDLENDQ